MKKIIINLVSLILCVSICMSMVGCKTDKKNQDSSSENTNQSDNDVVVESDYYLIKDEDSEYKVVLSDDAIYDEKFASEELVTFISESANIILPVVSPSEVQYSKDSHLIILGDALKEYSPIQEDIKSQNYHIKVKDSNIFITGGDGLGTLYGVYDFLHNQIEYEMYEQDCIAYKKDVKNLKLYDLDITDGPDILYRHPNYGPAYKFKNAHRYKMSRDPWIRGRANYVHNTIPEFFPYSQFKETHPEYYSSSADGNYDGRQICYTGHGNPETLKEMQDIVVNRIKELVNIEYNKGHFAESISFTHQDNPTWCQCAECQKSKEKYKTDAATLVHFINPVAKRVKEWMSEAWPGHDLNIAIFAYQVTEKAPVDKVGDKYVPIDDTIYLEDNVALFYAPFYMDYFYDFNHTKNIQYRETLEKWSAISKQFYLWTYSLYSLDYFLWSDNFNSMQSIYRDAKKFNTKMLFDQARYNADVLTAFDNLKMYLNAKLMWNVDEDFNQLIQNFFDNYFKEASASMKKFFDEYRTWMDYIRNTTSVSGVANTLPKKEYYPKNVLEGWMDYVEQAYKDIEVIKDYDSEEYKKIYDRIKKESLAITFHLILFYEDTYPEKVINDMKTQFKKDARYYGFTLYQEYMPLDEITKNW